MQSKFPGQAGEVLISDSLIEQYFENLQTFFQMFCDQIICFCTDLYAFDHQQYFPRQIRRDIEYAFSNNDDFQRVVYQQDTQIVKSDFMKQFLTLAKFLIIPRVLKCVEDVKIPAAYHTL